MSVIDNYKLIIEKINQQSNKKITLVAVSKNFSLSHIKPLLDYGHKHYGENKVQEDRKSTRLNSSHPSRSRMPSSA